MINQDSRVCGSVIFEPKPYPDTQGVRGRESVCGLALEEVVEAPSELVMMTPAF